MIINLFATVNSTCPMVVTNEIQSFVNSMNIVRKDDWCQLEFMINQVQNYFSTRLRQDYPMLTEHDIHLILLIRTDISNPRIAGIMNIESSSFRMGRYRLKKKMGIETDSFSSFIRKLYT